SDSRTTFASAFSVSYPTRALPASLPMASCRSMASWSSGCMSRASYRSAREGVQAYSCRPDAVITSPSHDFRHDGADGVAGELGQDGGARQPRGHHHRVVRLLPLRDGG